MNIDDYLGYIVLGIVAVFFVISTIKYFTYWRQLKKAFLQLGMEWPIPSQSELHDNLKRDFVKTFLSIYTIPIKAIKITWFMRTDNPVLLKPIRSIRRSLLVLIIFPIVLAAVSIVVAVLFWS